VGDSQFRGGTKGKDEYQCLMSKCIDKAIVDRADPAVTWEWIKFQQKVSSLNIART
jgi:hypothetical protein